MLSAPHGRRDGRLWLTLGLLCSFGALVFYKYTGFFLRTVGVQEGDHQSQHAPTHPP